jgi:DNA polymerase epsilon subunit 2
MLGVYDEMEEKEIPRLFILCGNFRSRPWLADGENIREYTGEYILRGSAFLLPTNEDITLKLDLFAQLANLLSSFPSLLSHSQFLLVPGPTDPWSSSVLPRPPLPETLLKALLAKIPNVTLGTNPCRVRWFSQEIVVFRDDLMARMMRNAVRFVGDEGVKKGDLKKAVSLTSLLTLSDNRFRRD